jgi:hypothetical protein
MLQTAPQPQPSSLVTGATASSSVNPTAVVVKVAANSKDDASIASSIGSSGCGSLTKKSKTQVATSGNAKCFLFPKTF